MIEPELEYEDQDRDAEIIDHHVNMLTEHFDHILIHVSRRDSENDTSYTMTRTKGNYYACYGIAKHWAIRQEQKTKNEAGE